MRDDLVPCTMEGYGDARRGDAMTREREREKARRAFTLLEKKKKKKEKENIKM